MSDLAPTVGSLVCGGKEYVLKGDDLKGVMESVNRLAILVREPLPDGKTLERPRVAGLDPKDVKRFEEGALALEE